MTVVIAMWTMVSGDDGGGCDEHRGVCVVMTVVGAIGTMVCSDDGGGCDEDDGVW